MTSKENNSNGQGRTWIPSPTPSPLLSDTNTVLADALGTRDPPETVCDLGQIAIPPRASVFPTVNWESASLARKDLGPGDFGGARSRAAALAKLSFGGDGPAIEAPGDRGGGGEAYLAAVAVPAGCAQQLSVWPGPEQRQEHRRRGAGGGGAQEPGGARPNPGAPPARGAQQRQQPGHGAQPGSAARAADRRGGSQRGGRGLGSPSRERRGRGGAGAAHHTQPRPSTPPPGA